MGRNRQAKTTDRASQSPGQQMFSKGGIGYITRRGVGGDRSVALTSMEGVKRLAMHSPLELLSLLPDLVPEVGLAVSTFTDLACAPGSIRLKAVTTNAKGESEEAPDGTAAVKALFASNPKEVGGLEDMLGQNLEMLLFSGMVACEGVAGAGGKGLKAVYPVNSLTLRFNRDTGGNLFLEQRQVSHTSGVGISAGAGGTYAPMPMERFFYDKIGGLPDDLYGRAPFSAALTEVLVCLAYMRDFLLAFHRVGTPKFDVGFDFEMWHKIAREIVGLTDAKDIDEWVTEKFNAAVEFFNNLEADDAFFHDKATGVNAIGSGDKWPDVPALWAMLRLRLVQSLKMLPTLMGIVEGTTETWSTVEWDIFAKRLRIYIGKALAPIVDCANLHLRLLGLPYTVEAEIDPVRTSQRLTDAQAEAQEINNEARKRDESWITQDDASMKITGSAAVGDAPERTAPPPAPAPTPEPKGNQRDRKAHSAYETPEDWEARILAELEELKEAA